MENSPQSCPRAFKSGGHIDEVLHYLLRQEPRMCIAARLDNTRSERINEAPQTRIRAGGYGLDMKSGGD